MTTGQQLRISRVVGLAGLAGGVLLGLLCGAQGRRVYAADSPGYVKPPAGSKLELVGAAICQNCHDEEAPNKKALYKQTLGFEFVRLWENSVWSNHDLHSQAYKNLLTSRTKKGGAANATAERMEESLRQYYANDKYTVAADVNCLACHASTKQPTNQVPPSKWKLDSFESVDGVGCEMCHGHGSAYQDPHQKSRLDDAKAPPGASRVVDWRTWAPAEKESFGLIDLRNPTVAAERCASCHVGNQAEGRFVTHLMYAAGHPPLPPLDLLAYTREQPRHWGLASEMPYLRYLAQDRTDAKDMPAYYAGKKGDPEKAWEVFHYRGGEQFVARRFAESTLATLGATLQLTGQLAGDAKRMDGGLDYAAFDCYSCHHNLVYPSDRQARGYDGVPGRPQFRAAPFALAHLVVGHAAGMKGAEGFAKHGDHLNRLQKELAQAFGAKSYGDPDAIARVTKEVADWSRKAVADLAKVRYTREETERLLGMVTAAAGRAPNLDGKPTLPSARAVADPEVAQLYAWAYETLVLELAGAPPEPKDGSPARPPESILKLQARLRDVVVTRLRPHAPFHYEQKATGGVPAPSHLPVDRRLGDRMKVFNAFRGDVFRDAFKGLDAK